MEPGLGVAVTLQGAPWKRTQAGRVELAGEAIASIHPCLELL